jgi:hypothetical protein
MLVEDVVKLVQEGISAGQADSAIGSFFRSAKGAAREVGLVPDTLEHDMYVNGYLAGCPGMLHVDINGRTCRKAERYVTLIGVGMVDSGWRPERNAEKYLSVAPQQVIN